MAVASAPDASIRTCRHSKCMRMRRGRARTLASAGALLALALLPSPAQAHGGPIAPVASSYLAKITGVPRGIVAKVIDADQSMWLAAAARDTVLVLDYRG